MPDLGPQRLDESAGYCLTLSGAPLAPGLAGHWTGSETLQARISPGAGYAPVATVTAAWATTDASGVTLTGNPAAQASPVVDLTVSKAAISGLSAGTYWLTVI